MTFEEADLNLIILLQPTTIEKVESKVGYAVRKRIGAEQSLFMDREAQIAAVEKTFEDAKLEIKEHYSKKGAHPVEILHVLPDDQMWKYPCAQVWQETRGITSVLFSMDTHTE